MTYNSALILLGLPAEEREEFIAHNDVAGMTTKKLQQAKAPSIPTNPENVNTESLSANIAPSAGNAPLATTAPFTHNLKTERDPDANIKYVEQCDVCGKTIADTFFNLTTALTNLPHLDPKLKEEKREEAD